MGKRALLRRRRKRIARTRLNYQPAGIEQLEDRRLLATVLWDGGGNGTSWTDAANWDGDKLPAASDEVQLASGSNVTLDTDVDVASLWVQRGSTLGLYQSELDADVTIDGVLNTRRDAVVNGQINVGVDGQLLLSAYSAPGAPYVGDSHLTVTGDLKNEGTVRLRSQAIEATHPCCRGANSTLVLTGGTFTNDGRIWVQYPSHGLRLDDIHFEIDGPVDNRGEVDLDFHLVARQDSWTSSGTIDVGLYQRYDQGLYPVVFDLKQGQLDYRGGDWIGGGRIDLSDATLIVTKPLSVTSALPDLYTTRTHVMGPAPVEVGADTNWFLFNTTIDTDLHVAGRITTRGDVSINGQLTNTSNSIIALSAFGRLYDDSLDGDANLTLAQSFTNLGEVRMYAGEYFNQHPYDIGDEARIVMTTGTFVNEGRLWAVEPGNDKQLGFRYEIVGDFTNAGDLDLEYNLFVETGTTTFGGDLNFGSYTDTEGDHSTTLTIEGAVVHYHTPLLSGNPRIELPSSTLQLDEPLTLDSMLSLVLDKSSIVGPGKLTIAEGGALLLFQSEIAAPMSVAGTLGARRDSRVSGPLSIEPSGVLSLHAFKDDYYYPSSYWGDVFLTVDRGFTNQGEIRIRSSQGFQEGGSRAWLTVVDGVLVNEGTITTLASLSETYQPQLRIVGDVYNAGTIIVQEKNLEFADGSLINAGAIHVGAGFTLRAVAGDLIQESGTIDLAGHLDIGAAHWLRANAGEVHGWGGQLTGYLENNALVTVTGGLQVSRDFRQLAGTTRLEQSELRAAGDVQLLGGRLTGPGQVRGAVTVDDVTIQPGTATAAGTLTIFSNLVMTPATQLDIDILSTSDADIDWLDVRGTLTVAGTLGLLPAENFDPHIGFRFAAASATNPTGTFDAVTGNYIDLTRRMDVALDATSVSVEVVAVDESAMVGDIRDRWNSGINVLRSALPSWADSLDAHGQNVAVLPDDLANRLSVADELAAWADDQLNPIDANAPITTLDQLRQAFEDAGYSQLCLLGDPQCGGELLQVPLTGSLTGLSAELEYNDATTLMLEGLNPDSDINGTLSTTGQLSWDWALGVDDASLYLSSTSPLSLSATANGTLAGTSVLPGGVFSFDVLPTSQTAATATLRLESGESAGRLRPQNSQLLLRSMLPTHWAALRWHSTRNCRCNHCRPSLRCTTSGPSHIQAARAT